MKTLQWRDDTEFDVDGVRFQCVLGDYSGRTSTERFVLLKDRRVLGDYAEVFARDTPKNMLEFGIFQGGSPALFTLWFGARKFVGIDICEPVAAFDEFCRTHSIGQNIRTHYRVSQTDEARIQEIVRKEFGSEPLDAIIDDASHHYALTRRTFEIAFPLLRPGGMYVIEDWGWAHWPGHKFSTYYLGKTAMSMLIMELLMLCASRGDLISEVRVFPAFAFIRKSPEATHVENFSLDRLIRKQNLEIVGAQDFKLPGLTRLVATQIAQLSKRRVIRTKEKLQRLFNGKK